METKTWKCCQCGKEIEQPVEVDLNGEKCQCGGNLLISGGSYNPEELE